MRKLKSILAVSAAVSALLTAGPAVLAQDVQSPDDTAPMGSGMMGGNSSNSMMGQNGSGGMMNMMTQMSQMMESCNRMMQAMMDDASQQGTGGEPGEPPAGGNKG